MLDIFHFHFFKNSYAAVTIGPMLSRSACQVSRMPRQRIQEAAHERFMYPYVGPNIASVLEGGALLTRLPPASGSISYPD